MVDSTTPSSEIFSKMQDFPQLKTTGINIGRDWLTWKKHFLSFLQKEDPKELYKDQWVTFFLMLIGPLGEQVYKDLSSRDAQRLKDFKTLFSNLDLYFIFGSRKKQKDENVESYIDKLMQVAIASTHSDPVSIVKEKIIQDLASTKFTGKAMVVVQSRGENLASSLQLLPLNEITLFWEYCVKLMSQENRENVPRELNFTLLQRPMECIRCGTIHVRNNCPAHGTQCANCKGYNHFTDKCKVRYVYNCSKCGCDHVQSRCMAFGKLCMKCGKTNHFSWLCLIPIVKDCSRCGTDHAMTTCPAQGHVCSRCNKPNHFKEKCVSNLTDENAQKQR